MNLNDASQSTEGEVRDTEKGAVPESETDK
jgi:hypothetical protein